MLSMNMARRKWILIVLTVFAAILQQIQATCVCNEKGTDACSCAGPVRPRPKHVKRPEFKLPPVGDNCWCSKTIIEPASLPEPCPKHKNHPTACHCQPVMAPPMHAVPQVNYPHAYVKDDTPPADPISISLAVQAGKAIQVPEAKLAYGFVRKPLNDQPKIYISSIKEEDLYALANDVITLKKPLATSKIKKIEADYPEPDEEELETEEYEPPSLTYKQLGYGPDDFQNTAFVPMPSPAKDAEEAGTLIDDGKGSGSDCGFKPGAITEIKHHKKFGPIRCIVKRY